MNNRDEKAVGVGLGLLESGFEVVAEGHELIDLGDDALLFSNRGNRKDYLFDLPNTQVV